MVVVVCLLMVMPYGNLILVKAVEAVDSHNCVVQANEIMLNVRDYEIEGEIFKTQLIPELDAGIIKLLSDETELATQTSVGGKVYEITNGLYSSSSFCIGASSIIVKKEIVAEKDISFNAESCASIDKTVIYSKNGNININSSEFIFNGIIYAPNGTVCINSHDTEIIGAVIARKIIIQGNYVSLKKDSQIAEMVNELTFVRDDRILEPITFYNVENNKITFMFGEDAPSYIKSIYARYDGAKFEKIEETTENTIRLDTFDFIDTADYMVIGIDNFGTEIKSKISTFKKEDDGIKQVVIDNDDDGIPDAYEVIMGTSPYSVDTDGDGFSDYYEVITLYTDPLIADDDLDFDEDGITNYEEMIWGTNPYLKDSDFDGTYDDDDTEPLAPQVRTELIVDENIIVKTGLFDSVQRYINENGEKCETIYNWFTGSIRKEAVGNKVVYGIFDGENRCTAMITKTPDISIVDAYTYEDNKIASVTHNGNRYVYSYDDNDNLIGVSVNDFELLKRYYDNGQLQSIFDENTNIDYNYDSYNQIIGIEVDGKEAYSMTYDENGLITEIYDYINNTTFEYKYDDDGTERVLKAVETSNGFGYEYNNDEDYYEVIYTDDDITKMQNTVYNGDVFKWDYSANTMLITGNSSIITSVDGYEHFNQTINVNNNSILSSDWLNSEYGTENIVYQDGKNIDYEYDQNANISSINVSDERRVSYEYDDLNRLIRENNYEANKSYVYFYDKYGNILSVTEYAYTEGKLGDIKSVTTYGYNNSHWNDLLTEYNSQSITYDLAGRPISYRDNMSFEWGKMNKLENVYANGDTIAYIYDIDGRRISKNINGSVTYYNYDCEKLVNVKNEEGVIWFIYDENDSVIGMECDNTAYYFEKNAQGDIERIFNSEGAFICSYLYDAFGNIISISGDEDVARLNPYRYRSYFYDEETGFYYLNSRYYDPTVRRFINADEIEFMGLSGSAASYNLFAYCENNPIRYNDPNGNIFKYNTSFNVSGTFESSVTYNPNQWVSYKERANCYAYALNIYANYAPAEKLQPGELSGTIYGNKSGANLSEKLINALYADLDKISRDLGYATDKYLKAWNWVSAGPVYGLGYDIALFISPESSNTEFDYHWYRKDSNGMWSHKRGYNYITNVDASGNLISDPLNADRDYGTCDYWIYVGTFRLYRYNVFK